MTSGTKINQLIGLMVELLEEQEVIPPAEWLEEHMILSSAGGSAITGPVRWSKPQRDLLNFYGAPGAQKIVVVGGAQVSKTTMLMGLSLWAAVHEPSRQLIVSTDEASAADLSNTRLASFIQESPLLTEHFAAFKSRTAQNTILSKSFRGGSVTFASQNSPSQLRGKSIKHLFLEEVSGWGGTSGGEGSPVQLALNRATTHKKMRAVVNSTPGTRDLCQLEPLWNDSDQREFFVPCHHCGHEQVLDWRNKDGTFRVRWERDEVDRPLFHTAQYYCSSCGEGWNDTERKKNINRGEWRATRSGGQWIGFRFPTLLSDLTSLERLAMDWESTKTGGLNALQSFVNNKLAEWWSDAGARPDVIKLNDRVESYSPQTIPNEVVALTCGADVQKDRIELEIVGWGAGLESWCIDYRVIPLPPEDPEAWDQLKTIISQQYTRVDGVVLPVKLTFVDTSYESTNVTNQIERLNRIAPKTGPILGVRGSNTYDSPIISQRITELKGNGRKVLTVGVSKAKEQVYTSLEIEPLLDEITKQIQSGKNGYCHFPEHLPDNYFRMLTAEEKKSKTDPKTGRKTHYWYCASGVRNEALDCRVYALAAAYSLTLNMNETLKRIEDTNKGTQQARQQQANTPSRINTSTGLFANGGNNGRFSRF
ncbi:terminase gpA endonuclease subunit [Novispirillum itersonii]|uniref:terminase gpA endonuclease subunit n=1 Tax=Novispirillum itersonii TaxID=189 RepID=UPI0003A0AF7A|nr:terminase gpA endonuclease subunit [Novispirillum itersonii]